MSRYIRIKEVSSAIEDLLSSKHLTIIKVLCDSDGKVLVSYGPGIGYETGHHYYLAEVTDGITRQVIKIKLDNLLVDATDIFRSIMEKDFGTEQKFYQSTSGLFEFIPKYISHGKHGELRWLTYKYAEGTVLGASHLTETGTVLNRIAGLTPAIRQLSTHQIAKGLELRRHDAKFYRDQLHAILKVQGDHISKYLSTEVIDFIKRLNEKNSHLLDTYCKYLTHGDLHPANIIINGDDTTLIDWENVHWDNHAYDLVSIWLRLWNFTQRDLLIHESRGDLASEESKDIFHYVVLHKILDEISFWHGVKTSNDKSSIYTGYAERALKVHVHTIETALSNNLLTSIS